MQDVEKVAAVFALQRRTFKAPTPIVVDFVRQFVYFTRYRVDADEGDVRRALGVVKMVAQAFRASELLPVDLDAGEAAIWRVRVGVDA